MGNSVNIEVKKCRDKTTLGTPCESNKPTINAYIDNLEIDVYGVFDQISFAKKDDMKPVFSQYKILSKAVLKNDAAQ